MTSAERLTAAIKREPTDHLPLCFEGIGYLAVPFVNELYPDPCERADFYLGEGVDAGIVLGCPRLSTEGVETREWEEPSPPGENGYPVLVKEYITPRGALTQRVRRRDYPFEEVVLFADHNVPLSRSVEWLVEEEEDLNVLECILWPPNDQESRLIREKAKQLRGFCDDRRILLSGHINGIGDPILWMSGTSAIMFAVDSPEFFAQCVDLVSQWNTACLKVQIDAGVDVVIRRGWYESTDFWSPDLFREFLFEPLKQEIEMAHEAGVYFTYVMNSEVWPLLDIFRELGFDVYSNIDPMTAGMDLADVKRELGDHMALYGGINNFLVLEDGTPEEVRRAVVEAAEKMAPGGGYIVGPGDAPDCMMAKRETTERNFYEMIRAWKEIRHCA